MGEAAFVQEVADWARSIPPGERQTLAIAGAPGSGKSTLAEALIDALPESMAAVLPMDGFHYDDEVLVPRGDRPRKGAPHTFDVGGFRALLARLKDNAEDEIAVPRFDRDLEIARAGARIVPRDVRLIVAEGNYLLLEDGAWRGIADMFDKRAYLDIPPEVLRDRLVERWKGYDLSEQDIIQKLEQNDLPNGRLIAARRADADWVVYQSGT